MSIERREAVPGRVVTVVLPWVAGAGGLMVYLLTLNQWISLLSLGTVARISGWGWQPELGQPLTFAVLYPFRWLPGPAIPLALNVFTTVCAAMVLVLLARSVALLPHDLTPDEPLRRDRSVAILSTPTAWMPPVLSAILCGLQLSFWEHATSASGEMIDLLVFAYVVRCLLEFRTDRNPSWLSHCVCVYGAGMANNWAMVGYLPVFCIALLRTTGFSPWLNRRFLLRGVFWGLAGLGLYVLLLALDSVSLRGQIGFWTAFQVHLKSQKDALASLRTPALRLLALASLLPLAVLSIRWRSHTVQAGDDTPLGVFLTKATGHAVHGLFFATSIWMALDPSFSPRHLGLGLPMLTSYYISALVLGYCAGYFLLLGSGGPRKRLARMPAVAGWVLLCALPLALAWRNLGQIRMTNGPAVHEFAQQLYSDLPAGKSVVLSEDARQVLLLRAELGVHGTEKDPLLLDTGSLPSARYHMLMADRFKSRWPVAPPTNGVGVVGLLRLRGLISRFATQEPVVYLHPSSGLFLEPFSDQPHGSIHYLMPCRDEEMLGSTLTEGVVATNQQIWHQRWTNGLQALAEYTQRKNQYDPPWAGRLLSRLRLIPERSPTALALGRVYSKALNYWGVELQRLGQWSEAGVWFRHALELNPDNLAAHINSRYNEQCQRGDRARLDAASVEQQFQDLFAKYDDWPAVLDADGPVDEPTFLFRTGRVLLPGENYRQAGMAFARCAELAPDWPVPKLWLAKSRVRLRAFAKALELTDTLQTSAQRLSGPGLADLLYCRATAMRGLGRTNEAGVCIEGYVDRYREHAEVLATAAELYSEGGQWAQALALLEELLKRDPNQAAVLANKGFAQLQLSQYPAAMATLTQALLLAPSDEEARLHRAVACLESGQLDAARDDYLELLKSADHSQNALFGLGAIAWRKHDTNAAIEFYQQYLSNGIPKSAQSLLASERLRQLKSGRGP